MLLLDDSELDRGAVSVSHSSADKATGGGVGVWSERVCSFGQASLESAISPYFRVEPDLGAWYALYVRSRHEKTVENSLRVKGYRVFSPSYRTKRKRVDRITEIEVPLFPGYVFCQFDSNKRLPILMTPGVVGVVGRGNKAEPVDETEIASLRTVSLAGRPVQPWPFLRIGQRIRFQAGPLAGAEGVFLRVKDEYHLVVSISLLQRAVSVVIENDAVAPLFVGERLTSFRELKNHRSR
jgi:transcription antitermination factor NusG